MKKIYLGDSVYAEFDGDAIILTTQNSPQDAEAELSTWIDEVERNQRENEREVEQQAWREQELLQEETDNT